MLKPGSDPLVTITCWALLAFMVAVFALALLRPLLIALDWLLSYSPAF